MCYYNGLRVTRAEYIRLKGIEREIKNLKLSRPVQSCFLYKDWPIIKPTADRKSFDIEFAHWEYIPSSVYDEHDLKESRKLYAWFNAKSENLFKNERGVVSMWREGALNGRCLVPSSYFFEFRHLPKIGKKGQKLASTEAIPYCITLREKPEYFFMAGISRSWTNQSRDQSADTFAIVTTEANSLMKQIHNKKLRMPTILPQELAEEWLKKDLPEQRIKEIASFQMPSKEMLAWPVSKDFQKAADPTVEFHYDNLPDLVYGD